MRPILLQGHQRPVTQMKYNREGDLLFTTAKDKVLMRISHIISRAALICESILTTSVNVYYSHNGERLGTYDGHSGAVWSVDVHPTSKIMATGAADDTVKIWQVQSGKCLKTYKLPTAVKCVQFSENGDLLLAITEARMGYDGTVHVFAIDADGEFSEEPILTFTSPNNKFTKAGWSYLSKYIITGHVDGSVSKYDGKTGELIANVSVHEKEITDLQFAPDLSYFITASKDQTAKILDTKNLKILKTYEADSSLNTAAITPRKDFVILGGGQDAKDVTTTAARQGKFEARFYHKIFQDEIGRLKGHFGPLNHIAVHPEGTGFASGGEDGYVRLNHFDKSYYDFLYDVERISRA